MAHSLVAAKRIRELADEIWLKHVREFRVILPGDAIGTANKTLILRRRFLDDFFVRSPPCPSSTHQRASYLPWEMITSNSLKP